MNILFLSSTIPLPLDHGHHLRTFNTLKALALHHNIYFIGFSKNGNYHENKQKLAKFCKSVDIVELNEGRYRWRLYWGLFLNLFSFRPFIAQKYYKKKAVKQIQEILNKTNINIVHFDMLPLARYYEHINSKKSVLVNHNVESQRLHTLARHKKNILSKAFWYSQYYKLRYFEQKMCRLFDLCIAVSEKDKASLLEMCGQINVKIIPNGVDAYYFTPNNYPIEEGSLVWTGAMDDPYNKDAVDYFLKEIYPLIKVEVPELKAYFIGKKPTGKLLELAKKDQLLKIIGYVDDVRPYVAKANVFIAPLRCGGGTKYKVLNALAQGKAVVTTSIGAEGLNIRHGENILIGDDPKTFAKNVIFILKYPEKAKIMAERGRELIEEHYDWGRIGYEMNRIYQE